MLQPDVFQEGANLAAGGDTAIPLPEDDPDIMTILLDMYVS